MRSVTKYSVDSSGDIKSILMKSEGKADGLVSIYLNLHLFAPEIRSSNSVVGDGCMNLELYCTTAERITPWILSGDE